jgi:hypothetical protein
MRYNLGLAKKPSKPCLAVTISTGVGTIDAGSWGATCLDTACTLYAFPATTPEIERDAWLRHCYLETDSRIPGFRKPPGRPSSARHDHHSIVGARWKHDFNNSTT